jgi:hypothetical protein
MSNAEAKSFSSDRGVASQAATGRDPFKIDGPTCLSFSTGRSSAYMLKRVIDANPREALARWLMVCFGNTGKEEEASLRFWRDCAKHWRIPIVGLEYVLGPNGPRTPIARVSLSRPSSPSAEASCQIGFRAFVRRS